MKKLSFIILTGLLIFSCTSGSKSENKESEKDSPKTEENSKTDVNKSNPKIIISEPVKEIKVLKHKEADANKPGEQTIEIDLGQGYTLFDEKAWFGGNDWSPDKLQLRKDGKTLYTWDYDKMERHPTLKNREFNDTYPRLIYKGTDQALVLFEVLSPPNDLTFEALVIDKGKFIKIEKTSSSLINNQSEMEVFFEKCFN